MERLLINLLLLFFISMIAFGIGYYYFYEEAQICDYEQSQSYQQNRQCDCNGWVLTRRDSLTETDGYKETVCIGRIEREYCTVVMQGRVFETDCER